MPQLKESQVYLNFFKQNLIIISGSGLLAALFLFISLSWQPHQTTWSGLLVMLYSQDNLSQRAMLTDQAVSLIRTSQLQSQLGIKSKVVVYKIAPLAITLEVSSSNEPQSLNDLGKVEKYSTSSFPLVQVGPNLASVKNPLNIFWLVLGFSGGLIIGVFISLIRFYYKHY